MSENLAAGNNFRQHLCRNFEIAQDAFFPLRCSKVHQLSAAGVGHISDMQSAAWAARKFPDQKAVDGSAENLSGFGLLVNAGHIVKDPANFQSAEITRKRQARLCAIPILPSQLRELRNIIGHARVLPDDRVVDWFPRLLVPDDGGFALIRNADCSKIRRLKSRSAHRTGNHAFSSPPDFLRIMFNPTRLWIDLLVFLLGDTDDLARTVEDDEARTGCALINGSNVIWHFHSTQRTGTESYVRKEVWSIFPALRMQLGIRY